MLDTDKLAKRAEEVYRKGVCCSEAIVYAFAEEAGKNAPEYMKMASGLCGGMGHGDDCGVLTGGACAIGLFLGRTSIDEAPKKKCSGISKQFVEQFTEMMGKVSCRELTDGITHGTPEHRNFCVKIVSAGAALAAKVINDNQN